MAVFALLRKRSVYLLVCHNTLRQQHLAKLKSGFYCTFIHIYSRKTFDRLGKLAVTVKFFFQPRYFKNLAAVFIQCRQLEGTTVLMAVIPQPQKMLKPLAVNEG